ncbi:hypothetical protein [Desulfosporosinus metallidurans]|uniref:Uncharacterized protein n=1 Tax=Desulfosporosinus metallidurans TaxID=1888891 RepID=A0A1Q8QFK7_9FIRM|nr:hypothetical protein [Desulfosporosinus metallidurans]OLN26114.1 hypothetical protein DSOL_5118 [Desulfosporosinus metallidurans]
MASELCPRCGSVKNMVITTSKTEIINSSGKNENVEVRNFHCETCTSFIRSEIVKVPES